jgi:hypothetical protein
MVQIIGGIDIALHCFQLGGNGNARVTGCMTTVTNPYGQTGQNHAISSNECAREYIEGSQSEYTIVNDKWENILDV